MNNENVSKSIGYRIRNLRNIKNISQSTLADKLKISRPVLNRIELGTRSIRDDELINIANFFGVTTDYLLGRNIDLGDTPVAAHLVDEDLTDEERQEITDYIEFKKAQYKKRHENK